MNTPNKFHFCLQLVKNNGSVSKSLCGSWTKAHQWYRAESAKRIFGHRSVKVYFCASNDEGELRTDDEVLVLGTE